MEVLTAKSHKNTFGVKEMFYICGFIDITVYTVSKFIKLSTSNYICVSKLMYSIVYFLKEMVGLHHEK